jgi:hypothetical protein
MLLAHDCQYVPLALTRLPHGPILFQFTRLHRDSLLSSFIPVLGFPPILRQVLLTLAHVLLFAVGNCVAEFPKNDISTSMSVFYVCPIYIPSQLFLSRARNVILQGGVCKGNR